MSSQVIQTALQLHQQLKFKESTSTLQKAMRRGFSKEQSVQAYHLMAKNAELSKDMLLAENFYLKLAKEGNEEPKILQHLLNFYNQTEQFEKTIPYLKKLYATWGHRADLSTYYARNLAYVGRFEAAEKVLAEQPPSPLVQYMKAELTFYWLPLNQVLQNLEFLKDTSTFKEITEQLDVEKAISFLRDAAIAAWGAGRSDLLKQTIQYYDLYIKMSEDGEVSFDVPASKAKQIEKDLINNVRYHQFLNILSKEQALPEDETKQALVLIGDSHTLIPHHHTVTCTNQIFQLQTQFLMGLNLWDIRPEACNLRKSALLHHFNQFQDQPLILSIGEIDSREDGGIWQNHKKTGKPVEEVLQNTVDLAFETLKQHRVSAQPTAIMGLPILSSYRQEKYQGEDWQAYQAYYQAFDTALKLKTEEMGWIYIETKHLRDVGESHIDNYHLKAAVTCEAISSQFKIA